MIFDFIDGAAGSEEGARRNHSALTEIRLQPRVLVNVENRSLSKRLFGRDWGLPFGIAPMGMCNLTWPNADRLLAAEAFRRKIPLCLSTAASTSLEEMRKFAPAELWFQLYVGQSVDHAFDLTDRAAAAGYEVLVLTVDVPQVSRRIRDLRNGFQVPFRFGPRQVLDFASHPRWSLATLSQGIPRPMNFEGHHDGGGFQRGESRAKVDWDFLHRLRDRWKAKLVVKGVLSHADAVKIKAAGADAVYVSNHGGRQLDSAPAAIQALAPIRAAVGPDYPLLFDSGPRSGEDIVKALACGADFVMLGRPLLFALGAGGAAGLARVMDILAEDLSVTLALLGRRSVEEIDASVLAASPGNVLAGFGTMVWREDTQPTREEQLAVTEKRKIRGGNLLARALHEKGITHAFTLAGGFCNPALEGFMECQMPVINCPHEQIAGHLADGHARLTRKPTVCLVGPEGFANAVPAMMEAWGERSPVIFVTGSSTLKRQGAGGFKEIDDVAIAAPLTKYSIEITEGARIGEFVDRAYQIATSGYPGPVHLSLPVDIMFSSFEEDIGREERPFDRSARAPARAWPDPKALAPLLERIAEAKRPILIGGHSTWWSGNEKLLERTGQDLNIPVFNVPYHQKLLGEDSSAYMGLADIHQYPPSRFALQESDLAIMVGGRLDNQMNFGNPPLFPADKRLLCVNGSHEELDFNRAADDLLLSDPGAFLEALLELKQSGNWALDRDWLDLNRAKRGEWVENTLDSLAADCRSPEFTDRIHPLEIPLAVQEALGENDWLVFDGGNTHFWSEIAVNLAGWQGKKLAGIMHPGSYSMLGVGVSFALSAKNLHRQSNVVLISGDGAFLSGGLSVEAAFQEKCPIVVVIDNNGGLDCISQQQERLFESGTHFATDFRDIPFHSMFEGLGGHGELVERREDLLPAIQRAIASGKTACVNVKAKGVISPIVLATTNKRDKASIE